MDQLSSIKKQFFFPPNDMSTHSEHEANFIQSPTLITALLRLPPSPIPPASPRRGRRRQSPSSPRRRRRAGRRGRGTPPPHTALRWASRLESESDMGWGSGLGVGLMRIDENRSNELGSAVLGRKITPTRRSYNKINGDKA